MCWNNTNQFIIESLSYKHSNQLINSQFFIVCIYIQFLLLYHTIVGMAIDILTARRDNRSVVTIINAIKHNFIVNSSFITIQNHTIKRERIIIMIKHNSRRVWNKRKFLFPININIAKYLIYFSEQHKRKTVSFPRIWFFQFSWQSFVLRGRYGPQTLEPLCDKVAALAAPDGGLLAVGLHETRLANITVITVNQHSILERWQSPLN